ncbi:MAG: hypothetical protein EF813_12540 [Methanosarcinales archaeon]|nr:MAG: hypothetical protein EF813_12540 [Methanosarcinales archaeon]
MKRYNMIGIVLVVLLLGISTAVATDTVTRTLQETALPNDTIMVSLTINFEDQAAVDRLVITETMPEGWAVVDASNGGNTATTGKITWMYMTVTGGTLPEDGAVFTYNVTVPADANGLCPFSGIYGTNVAGTDVDVLGDVNITIAGSNITAPTVTASTPTGTVNGSLGWDNDTMTFTPDADLAYSTTYDVTIGTGAEDLAGNALAADFVWNFTTVAEANTTVAPTVDANTPTGTDVAISTVITATFSDAMNQTFVEAAFSISPAVNGSLGWDNDTMTFTPDADLAYSTTYDVTIGTGAEDLAGNSLEESFVWNFTTESDMSDVPTILSTKLSQNVVLSDGNDSTTLTVQASSSIDIASVTVNLSAIGGPDEQALDGMLMEGIGTWTATFNTTTAGTFDLTVTVTDNDGNSATDDVTLTAGPYKYTLALMIGWNMVSLPYDIAAVGIDTTQKLGDLITDAGVSCYYVAWFNPESQSMESDLISPPDGMPQDTTYDILGGQAYFVFVDDNMNVDVVGTLW